MIYDSFLEKAHVPLLRQSSHNKCYRAGCGIRVQARGLLQSSTPLRKISFRCNAVRKGVAGIELLLRRKISAEDVGLDYEVTGLHKLIIECGVCLEVYRTVAATGVAEDGNIDAGLDLGRAGAGGGMGGMVL